MSEIFRRSEQTKQFFGDEGDRLIHELRLVMGTTEKEITQFFAAGGENSELFQRVADFLEKKPKPKPATRQEIVSMLKECALAAAYMTEGLLKAKKGAK